MTGGSRKAARVQVSARLTWTFAARAALGRARRARPRPRTGRFRGTCAGLRRRVTAAPIGADSGHARARGSCRFTIATLLEQTVDAAARQLGAQGPGSGRLHGAFRTTLPRDRQGPADGPSGSAVQRIQATYDITSPAFRRYSGSPLVAVVSRPRTVPVDGSMMSMRRAPDGSSCT
jgi:hypothetical protein